MKRIALLIAALALLVAITAASSPIPGIPTCTSDYDACFAECQNEGPPSWRCIHGCEAEWVCCSFGCDGHLPPV